MPDWEDTIADSVEVVTSTKPTALREIVCETDPKNLLDEAAMIKFVSPFETARIYIQFDVLATVEQKIGFREDWPGVDEGVGAGAGAVAADYIGPPIAMYLHYWEGSQPTVGYGCRLRLVVQCQASDRRCSDCIPMYRVGRAVEAGGVVEILSPATVHHVAVGEVAAILAVMEMFHRSKADEQEVAIRTCLNTNAC
jgi:hypothetical protein